MISVTDSLLNTFSNILSEKVFVVRLGNTVRLCVFGTYDVGFYALIVSLHYLSLIIQ